MVVGFTDCCCALLTLHWSADLETVDYHFRLLLLLDEEKMQITVMSSGAHLSRQADEIYSWQSPEEADHLSLCYDAGGRSDVSPSR